MRKLFNFSLLALLVLFLAACETTDPPGGGNQEPDPTPEAEYATYSVFGPATLQTDSGDATGVSGELAVTSTEDFAADATLSFSITGPDGQVGHQPRQQNPTERTGNRHLSTSLDVPDFIDYEEGEYVIDVFLDDELIDTITYDLTGYESGLDPVKATAEATIQSVDVSFEEIDAERIAVSLHNDSREGDHQLIGASLRPTDALSLELAPAFPLNRVDDYSLTIRADSATLLGRAEAEDVENHTPARFLRYRKGVDLEEKLELYYNTFTVAVPEGREPEAANPGDPAYYGRAVLAMPLGAPDPSEDLGIPFVLNRGSRSAAGEAVWEEGSRFISDIIEIHSEADIDALPDPRYCDIEVDEEEDCKHMDGLRLGTLWGADELDIDFGELLTHPIPAPIKAEGAPLGSLPAPTAIPIGNDSVQISWDEVEGATHYLVTVFDLTDFPELPPLRHLFLLEGTELTVTSTELLPIDLAARSYGAEVFASAGHPFMPGATNQPAALDDVPFGKQ